MFWKSTKVIDSEDPNGGGVVDLDPQAVPPITKSPEEKRFLIKLDIFLLTFGCISQVIKYIDQTNINFAYVSGMQDALKLTGNELNYFTTYFNVGYCLMLIPSQIIITRFRPSIWLSSLEFFWGVMTGAIAACKNAQQIYVLRAFIGIAESSAYPGTVTLLMTWYTPLEMAKRIGFYHSCQGIGSMLAGALQTAFYQELNGRYGIAGWQWTFIINAIMTIGIAGFGFFMIPDFPDNPNPRAKWFKPKDQEIALSRLNRFSRVSPSPINLACLKRTLMNPILYALVWIYVGLLIAPSGNTYFNLWLRSLTYADGTKIWSVAALNAIPIGGSAMQVAAVWTFAYASDLFRTRWVCLLIICFIGLPSSIILSIWNVPDSAKYYAFFMFFFTTSSGPPLWSWMSDMHPLDAEQRALIIGICISLYYAVNAWSNVLIFPASQAPHYKYGFQVTVALWVTCGMVIVALRIYDVKVVRPRNHRMAMEARDELDAHMAVTAVGPTMTAIDHEFESKEDATKPGEISVRANPVPAL